MTEIPPASRARPVKGEGRKLGRHTLLTDELRDRIAGAMACGAPFVRACQANGVALSTAKDWKKRGETGEEPFASFTEAVAGARARFVTQNVRRIDDAAEKDWKAAAWLLERRDPAFRKTDRLESKSKVEHSGKVEMKPDFGALTEADQDQLRKLLGKAAEG